MYVCIFQNLEETVRISYNANTPGKSMNPTILPPAMSKNPIVHRPRQVFRATSRILT